MVRTGKRSDPSAALAFLSVGFVLPNAVDTRL